MRLQDKSKPILPKAYESKWSRWMERKIAFLPGEVCEQAALKL